MRDTGQANLLTGQFKIWGAGSMLWGPILTDTTLHSHDDYDELLSGVYYVCVPKNSGELMIHAENEIVRHTPCEGQWVFFSPQTPHAVSKNLTHELRLSVAFNFS